MLHITPIFLLVFAFSTGITTIAKANQSTSSTGVVCSNSTSMPHQPTIVKAPNSITTPLPRTFTLVTNCGDITIRTFENSVPITLSVLSALAQADYFDRSNCHRLTTRGLFVLQCGDPTETGSGNPGFRYVDENLPQAAIDNYLPGYVAMANSGPGTNGSQFFITTKATTLAPNYSIWGKVIKGMDIVNHISAQGVLGGGSDGPPAFKLEIRDVLVDQFATFSLKQLQDHYLATIDTTSQNSNQITELNSQITSLQAQLEVSRQKTQESLDLVKNLQETISNLNILIEQSKTKVQELQKIRALTCRKGNSYFSVIGNPPRCPAGSKQIKS